MALTSDGRVYTWGWGIHGQLGHGTCDNEYYPKLLQFEDACMQITAGHAHSLILTCDGKLYGFGSNAFGQLATDNSIGNKITQPIRIFLQPHIHIPIEKVAASYFHNVSNKYTKLLGTNYFSKESFKNTSYIIIDDSSLSLVVKH